MAETIHRHWSAFTLVGVLLLVMAGAFFWSDPSRAETSPGGEGSAASLDPVTKSRLAAIRQRLCLGNEELAVLGCGSQNAEEILHALVQWIENNKTQLDALHQTAVGASATIEQLTRQMNLGTSSAEAAGQMASSSAQIIESETSLVALYSQAATAVSSKLSELQAAQWQAIRSADPNLGDYRFISALNDSQRTALRNALENGAVAATADAVLSSDQRSALANLLALREQSLPGVIAAEAAVVH